MSSMNYKLTVSCLEHLRYSSRLACKGFRLLTANFNSDAELIMCRTLCVTNNCITNRYLSSSTEKSLNSLSDSIIGMVMKRQQQIKAGSTFQVRLMKRSASQKASPTIKHIRTEPRKSQFTQAILDRR